MTKELATKNDSTLVEFGEFNQEKLDNITARLLELPQADCPVFHRFEPGMYIRELHAPAGSLAVGHFQKTRHFNVFIQGKVLMLNPDGSQVVLTAPMMFWSDPGQKVGYVLEDMIWSNVYYTNETDVSKLEEMYLEPSKEKNEFIDNQLLLTYEHEHEDYQLVLKEFNFTEEQVQEQVNLDNMRELPIGIYKFKTAKSSIHGTGIRATANIEPGELIGPALIANQRTVLGRYTNHSKTPNAEMVLLDNGDVAMIALTFIQGSKGGIDGDEILIDYRISLGWAFPKLEQIQGETL